ncbi:hypothetical protein DAPPUDRAFT_263219 [Daphnia pulex]|uniref:Uncharacterized protein n=1 Tax=Daphnia pulex TaxID=6669 RepID=E9HPC9_DAPPU|nr:hypothetical protein DAPPUDRAFT_263219 [Daphnia pulex]|eukprot:EFX66434.1 hypothetical protein DAPPUDRAFT_263219 [Daphnia pulex]
MDGILKELENETDRAVSCQETVESARSEGQSPSIQSRSPPLVRTLTGDRFLSGSMSVESTAESMVMMLSVQAIDSVLVSEYWWVWLDLTDVDHSSCNELVSVALTNLAIIQIQVMSKDVALYWTVSSVYGLAQNLVLLSSSFRRQET